MPSLLTRVLRGLGRAVTSTTPTATSRADPATTSPTPSRSATAPKAGTSRQAAASQQAAAAGVVVWDVARHGLPVFTYAPDPDGEADPGEVVWTWVPYEDDPTQGKDRPVLVLARAGGRIIVAQMTSKDHDRDAAQEARWGRYWHDVGTGPWDRQGRPSEVRLDRLLSVPPETVRREGATVRRTVFDGVVAALRRHWAPVAS